MSDTLINDVSDTALWVAVYRARESKRPDAIFKDPFAEILAGERGVSIENKMSDSKYVQWAVVVRTWIIDSYIRQLISEGVDTIINLGAGLDSRPYRMDLPKTLRWVEIDFPQIIALKTERLANETPKCGLERIALDLSNPSARKDTFTRLNSQCQNAVIITEGVIPYLSNDNVGSLAKALKEQPHFRHWITEYSSPELFAFLNRPARKKEMRNAPFLFNPPDYFPFFKERGWAKRQISYIGETGNKVGRPVPHSWWVKFVQAAFMSKKTVEKYSRLNAYVLLEPS